MAPLSAKLYMLYSNPSTLNQKMTFNFAHHIQIFDKYLLLYDGDYCVAIDAAWQ